MSFRRVADEVEHHGLHLLRGLDDVAEPLRQRCPEHQGIEPGRTPLRLRRRDLAR